MKIKTVQSLSNIDTLDGLIKWVSQMATDIVNVINGKVSLTDNCQTSLVTVNFTAANTEIPVPHSLGMVPQGYLDAGKSAAITVFDGTTSNTSSTLFVKSSGVGTAKLLIF